MYFTTYSKRTLAVDLDAAEHVVVVVAVRAPDPLGVRGEDPVADVSRGRGGRVQI